MLVAVIVGSFTLGGVGLAFFGQWLLERQRAGRFERTVVSSIMLEMALTGASLKAAVLMKQRWRKMLRKDIWDRYGAEIVNFLPQHLVKALHVVYVDGFDSVQEAYEKGTQGLISKETGATLLSWAYQTDRLLQLIQERRRLDSGLRPILNRFSRLRSQNTEEPSLDDVLKELKTYAHQHLLDDGYSEEVSSHDATR